MPTDIILNTIFIQIQPRGITDINAIFAPARTSEKFSLKFEFTIVTETKKKKIAEILSIFGKFNLNFKINVAKYKFHVKYSFFQQIQKMFKK